MEQEWVVLRKKARIPGGVRASLYLGKKMICQGESRAHFEKIRGNIPA